jgi:SAM-dependent methyltransferase
MSGPWTGRRVLDTFEGWQSEHTELSGQLDAQSQGYVVYHARRYARLLEAVEDLVARVRGRDPVHILDVGPNVQTALLRKLHPEAIVDTLGFAHPAVPADNLARHVRFDLNETPDSSRWPAADRRYDVIVMAEVLEHLYVPAQAVLGFLAQQVRPPGFILLQTPNAAALHKRLALLRGDNPVEAPRLSRENPGHLHEYTLAELRDQVAASGLTIDWLRAENYFGSGTGARLYQAAGQLLPATLRHGVTVCLRVEV